jgi:hypothetical protein
MPHIVLSSPTFLINAVLYVIGIPRALDGLSNWWLHLSGGVDETEHVVEDVVGAVCGQKLEGLGVAHGPALLLDLRVVVSVVMFTSYSELWMSHTRSAPLTTTRIPPFSLLGCASTVAIWCSMRWKGSSCVHISYQPLLSCQYYDA